MFFCPFGTVINSKEDLKKFAFKKNNLQVEISNIKELDENEKYFDIEIQFLGFGRMEYYSYVVFVEDVPNGYKITNVRRMQLY